MMDRRVTLPIQVAAVGVLGLPALPASANMGLPLIAVFLPPLWIALVPIIVLEAILIARLGPHPLPRTLGAVAIANVVSTVMGVPLLWFLLATGQMMCCGAALGLNSTFAKVYAVTVQAPWLIPYESDFGWMVPSALFTMAVLCAGMSILVEAPITSRLLRADAKPVWRPTVAANIASYVALGLGSWLLVRSGLNMGALNRLFMPIWESLAVGVALAASWLAK